MKPNSFIKKIFPKKYLRNLQDKIISLGPNSKININRFLILKSISLIIIFFLILSFSNIGYLLAPIGCIVFYFIYDYYLLDYKIKKRIGLLEHDAIFFFEVLSLSLQSNQNLQQCLKITSDAIDSELSLEFREMLGEVKLGKSLTEALENLKNRIPSKSINNVILNVIQANIYGNNLEDALNNQIDYLLDKRILEIKGQINKMPTKISIISVFFFIPLIILLILGPVLISYFG